MSRFIVIETAMWLDLIVPVYDSFNRTKSWSSPFYLAKESLNLAISLRMIYPRSDMSNSVIFKEFSESVVSSLRIS